MPAAQILQAMKKGMAIRMSIFGFFQSLLGGMGTGTIYALLGISCSLIFGRLQICSVLHGDLTILAAYLCYVGYNNWGIDPFITVVFLLPLFFLLGYLIQNWFMKPFMKLETWKGRYEGQVMVSWGIGMVIMALEYIVFSGTFKTLAVPYRNATVTVGRFTIPVVHILAFVITILLIIIVEMVLKRTNLGIQIRACSSDTVTANLSGIHVDKVCAITFGISGMLAAIAGLFFALTNQLSPADGFELTFLGWVAVILGTMGNLKGALFAGLLMGIVQSLTSYFWIPNMANSMIYIVLILILLFKPNGMFGRKGMRGTAA